MRRSSQHQQTGFQRGGRRRSAAQPVSLTIGGKPATLLYVGAAPYEVWSVLQVNAVVPNDAGSGQQPVILMIGANDNSQQQVTVAIK
jgi:uncharacterized protein (TIGR03437 family)